MAREQGQDVSPCRTCTIQAGGSFVYDAHIKEVLSDEGIDVDPEALQLIDSNPGDLRALLKDLQALLKFLKIHRWICRPFRISSTSRRDVGLMSSNPSRTYTAGSGSEVYQL